MHCLFFYGPHMLMDLGVGVEGDAEDFWSSVQRQQVATHWDERMKAFLLGLQGEKRYCWFLSRNLQLLLARPRLHTHGMVSHDWSGFPIIWMRGRRSEIVRIRRT